MMSKEQKRSHFVAVAPRFLRSINLQHDWQSGDSTVGYIVTPNVSQALEQLRNGLMSENGQRAFVLTGPYGTGKSAFAVFLSHLLGRDAHVAEMGRNLFASEYTEISKAFQHIRHPGIEKEGFLLILVTARRRPIAQLLLEGILDATRGMELTASLKELQTRIKEALQKKLWLDTSIIIRGLQDIQAEAKKQAFAGILLLVDEAGKTLEYAVQDRVGGDVYVFQELAEYANRQMQIPLLFLITLHQMFDDYVELSDRTLRNEWNKVQERFQNIQFSESAGTTIKLIASALESASDVPGRASAELDDALSEIKKGGIQLPLGLEYSEFEKIAPRSWPLHPSLLLTMPYLFRRLAQNERSIFSYLTSQEPFGFQSFIDQPADNGDNFIRLQDIYSYLLANFEAGLTRLPHAKRLLEANDIINSRHHLTYYQLEIVRTVALLNVLSEICPLRASPQMIRFAVSTKEPIEHELEILRQQSVLTYRRLDNSYRVWEGSDVDIEARIKEGRRKLQLESISPLESLCNHLPSRTLVARRHSLKTGVNRYFNLIYSDSLSNNILKAAECPIDAAGTIIVLLPQANLERLKEMALKETEFGKRLIIAMPTQIDALRSVVEEVACLRWVEQNTVELRDDRIARRELSLRLAMGEQYLAQYLQNLLDPRPAPNGNSCQWIWAGKVQRPKRSVDVAKLLSEACDRIYRLSPIVRNELVVRKKLSSAAAAARRSLLEHMLERRSEACLGIEGYPPARSIYESLLRATEIHFFNIDTQQWDFQPPPMANECDLRPCWDEIENTVFSKEIQRVKLVDLFKRLSNVPYGLPDGAHPILFTAFYLHFQDELFLYREETFIPEVQTAHLELLQRRPDLFSVSGAKLDGTRKAVVKRLAKGLKQVPKIASVVRALYRMLNTLPTLTQKTSQIGNALTMKVRDCLLLAASPEQLLFVDLPQCFDIEPFMQGQLRQEDMDHFFEQLNSSLSTLRDYAPNLLQNNRNLLLKHCGLVQNMDGWYELERRAKFLAPRFKHEVLTPFLTCVSNGIEDNHNVRPALALIASRPFEQWTDMDLQSFDSLAEGMGSLFRQAWRNYGDVKPVLTEEEFEQKEVYRKTLEPQLQKLGGNGNSRALAAALRELLKQLESNQMGML